MTEYKFKTGDRVKMVSNEIKYHVPVGTEGTVAGTYSEDDEFDYRVKFGYRGEYAVREDELTLVETNHKDETLGRWLVENPYGAQSVLVEYAPGEYVWEGSGNTPAFTFHYYKTTSTVTELHLAEGGHEVTDALETTKKELYLCGEFDTAVAEAKAMKDVPLDTALELVAYRYNRHDVFKHYQKVKNRKPYQAPEVPKKGDYVRLTMRDGSTQEGEVRAVQDNSRANWPNQTVFLGNTFSAYIYDNHQPDSRDYWTVVKVEKVQRPWKVGDVVPAGTVVGKRWLGRDVDDTHSIALCNNSVNGVKHFATDRKIEWMED